MEKGFLVNDYELIDSGNDKKLERFGSIIIERPCFSAPWEPLLKEAWQKKDLTFFRDGAKKESWAYSNKKIPNSWEIEHGSVKLKVSPTDFGHLGIFPEHKVVCEKLSKKELENKTILNLFAYTGFVSIYCAINGANVVHLDASKPSVLWAQENARLNGSNLPIRYIVDDAIQFIKREIRRKKIYDGIILDPPTYGRGPKGQVFKIEKEFSYLMNQIHLLLNKKSSFLCLSSHTPGYLPSTLQAMIEQDNKGGTTEADEMRLISKKGKSVSVGCYALWKK